MTRGRASCWTALAALGLGACGWHAGLVAPGGARSVAVEVFETDSEVLERNLEPILAEALSGAVQDLVGTPLVAPSRADLVVRGQILGYSRRSGVRDTKNRLKETGVLVRVAAELFDRRSGEVIVPSIQRHVWSGYTLGPDASAHEAEARKRGIRHVAETLVLDLFREAGASTRAAGESGGVEDANGTTASAGHETVPISANAGSGSG